MDIQSEVQKIHHQFGIIEKSNYEIQKLFDRTIKEVVTDMGTNGNMRSAEEWGNLTSCELNHTDFIRMIQTEAYNQAIRDAAENAEVKEEFGNPYDPHSNYYVVDEQSILKLLK